MKNLPKPTKPIPKNPDPKNPKPIYIPNNPIRRELPDDPNIIKR